ncbi:MAG TPA: hypothetical protein VGL46_05025 [Pseudonocardiaceae bacterium]|jgi:hypothetical protein
MWVLDHLADLEADFLVFYRIDDIGELTGPRFLSLAIRVFAYQGVMAARAMAQQETASGSSRRNESEVRHVDSSREAISADPALGQLVSWGSG